MNISGKIQLLNNESSEEIKATISEVIQSLKEELNDNIEFDKNIEWQTKKSRKGLAPGVGELLLFAGTFSSGIATGVIANYLTKFLEKKLSKKKDVKADNNKIVILLEEAKIIIEIQEDK